MIRDLFCLESDGVLGAEESSGGGVPSEGLLSAVRCPL